MSRRAAHLGKAVREISHLRVVLAISTTSEACFWAALATLSGWCSRRLKKEELVCGVFRVLSRVKGVAVGTVK